MNSMIETDFLFQEIDQSTYISKRIGFPSNDFVNG